MPAPVFLLTDFGTSDVYVGVVKGVIAGLAPDSPLIDLTHEVPPQDVRAAAASLLFAQPYLPAGSVVCCVVDPGVGTSRAPLALELGTATGVLRLVCPDNGIVSPLLQLVRRAVVTDDPAFHLPAPSATFHGRDIFAPVTAHLAGGVGIDRLGREIDPGELATIPWPRPVKEADRWRGTVIHVDHFGNLISNLDGQLLKGDRWLVKLGDRRIKGVSPTFGTVAIGEPVAYLGSSGYLELALRQGNAAAEWRAEVGDEIEIEPVD